jgi:hypothetical protein
MYSHQHAAGPNFTITNCTGAFRATPSPNIPNSQPAPFTGARLTIDDLAGSETITKPHVAEALQYRARGDVG